MAFCIRAEASLRIVLVSIFASIDLILRSFWTFGGIYSAFLIVASMVWISLELQIVEPHGCRDDLAFGVDEEVAGM